MARRKNKKSSSQQKIGKDLAPVATENPPVCAVSDSGQKQAASSSASEPPESRTGKRNLQKKADSADQDDKSARQTGRVSLVTFMAGMFLSLVLGIYLGSLLPGAREDSRNPEPIPPSISSTTPLGMRETTAEFSPPKETGGTESKPEQPLLNAASPDIPPKLASRIAELETATAALAHNDEKAWIELGNLYFDTSQPQKAIGAYQHALAISPNNPDVLTDMGIMYREMHDFSKAVESFRRASAIKPDHVNAIFNEGVVLSMDLHQKEEAIKAWERLLELNPDAVAPNGQPVAKMVEALRK